MLSSNRLTYKLLTDDDFNLFYELYTNEAVMRYSYKSMLANREDAVTKFREVLDGQTDDRRGNAYVALLVNTNVPIGIIEYDILQLFDQGGVASISFHLMPAFWGEGYGYEMAQALVDEIFNETDIHRICGRCQAEHIASEKILKKLAMYKEGVSRASFFKNNTWNDEIVYSILKEDWLKCHELTKKGKVLLFG